MHFVAGTQAECGIHLAFRIGFEENGPRGLAGALKFGRLGLQGMGRPWGISNSCVGTILGFAGFDHQRSDQRQGLILLDHRHVAVIGVEAGVRSGAMAAMALAAEPITISTNRV